MNSSDKITRSSFGLVSGRGALAATTLTLTVIAACSSSSSGGNNGNTTSDSGTSSSSSGGGSSSGGSSSGGASSGGATDGGGLTCQMPVPEIADAAALTDSSGGSCSTAGGAVTGPADDHCGGSGDAGDAGEAVRQATDPAACCGTTDAAGDDEASTDPACNDAGLVVDGGADDGTCCDSDYSPTMYGQQGSDDDCKYDVTWTSTPICKGVPVYFTVHANKRDGATAFGSGAPLTGAGPFAEVTLNCATVATSNQTATPPVESQPGVYQVGPITFQDSGKWNVRFHFDEHCYDELPTSPHGHASFWVNVP